MRKLIVGLGDRSYPIYIGKGLLAEKQLLARCVVASKVLIVTNDTIAPFYLEKLLRVLQDKICDVVVLPDGEKYKNIDTLNMVFEKLLENNHNRSTTLIALGGGVIGDMTGFAAACYQRGVSFIQMPTTLLAQVDSSVGGKTGVNHRLGKNMIGAFHQPVCVIIDTDTLTTLPEREYISGIAEIIKYGLISDADFFVWLEENMEHVLSRNADAISYAVEKSCDNKARVVELDEKESGARALLNLGHTFGHAIESGQNYSGLLHGEAVAVGIIVAATLSRNLGFITENDHKRITALIKKARLPYSVPVEVTNDVFLEYIKRDKKAVDNRIRLILLRSIGEGMIYDGSSETGIVSAVDECRGGTV